VGARRALCRRPIGTIGSARVVRGARQAWVQSFRRTPRNDRSTRGSGASTIRYSRDVTESRSGALIRQARQRAGLSQAQVARRAGVTQSVVSAYESGARQPSLPMLERLVAATGLELELAVRECGGHESIEPGRLRDHVQRHHAQIHEIAGRFGLSNPRLFGSAARGEDRPGSDIDLLVDVAPGVGLLALARCQRELEDLLGVPVDLVPARDLKAGVARTALREAVAV